MQSHLIKYCRIYAALILAGAGIAGLIDQTTMIVLVVVLCVLPNRDCIPAGRKA
jgi:hypothetical protein